MGKLYDAMLKQDAAKAAQAAQAKKKPAKATAASKVAPGEFKPQSYSLADSDVAFITDEMHRRRVNSKSEALRAILAEARGGK